MRINRVPKKKDIARRMVITWIITFTAGLIIGMIMGGLLW